MARFRARRRFANTGYRSSFGWRLGGHMYAVKVFVEYRVTAKFSAQTYRPQSARETLENAPVSKLIGTFYPLEGDIVHQRGDEQS
jgi:hypothetical protein